jgi:hypothetical protein
MKTLALWLSLAAVATAQQDRATEMRVNMLKQQLGLSDEQTAKVREIFDKDVEKIRELLTDEQKTKFEELRRNPGGGGGNQFRFGGGQGGFGGGRNFGQMQMDNLKTELGLSDEQVEKIKPIVEEFNAQAQKRMEELRQGGFQGLDWAGELQKAQDNMKAFSDKVKAHLTDDQKAKADQMMERMTGWMRAIPGMLQRFQPGGTGGAPTPTRATVEERVKKAVDALQFEKEDERAAVKELIEKAIRAQEAVDDYVKSSRETLGAAAGNRELSNEALEDKLADQRKERRRLEKDLKDAQDRLADVVTARQELELVRQGVLR